MAVLKLCGELVPHGGELGVDLVEVGLLLDEHGVLLVDGAGGVDASV